MKCYGNVITSSEKCRKCEYFLSCRYYRMTRKKVDAREHIVSFDAAQELYECADFKNIPGGEEKRDFRKEIIAALSSFFRYMLELDEYSLGIICEVISPEKRGTHCTIPYLSKVHGCSRQAMHRKLMKIISAHPELTGLFRNTLYKLSDARQSFLRRRAAAAVKK